MYSTEPDILYEGLYYNVVLPLCGRVNHVCLKTARPEFDSQSVVYIRVIFFYLKIYTPVRNIDMLSSESLWDIPSD